MHPVDLVQTERRMMRVGTDAVNKEAEVNHRWFDMKPLLKVSKQSKSHTKKRTNKCVFYTKNQAKNCVKCQMIL